MTQPATAVLQEGTRTVTRLDIQRFSHSVGETTPIHHDVDAARAAGYDDLVAPPYFFTVVGMALGRDVPSSGLREDGLGAHEDIGPNVVAGGTAVEWRGAPIVAGDTVTVQVSLVGEVQKEGRSGPLLISTYRRVYSVGGEPRVIEEYQRVSRS